MIDFLTNSGIDKNIFTLIFMLIFVSALSLFHKVFMGDLLKIKSKWLLFTLYNCIAAALFIINPGFTVGWIILLLIILFVYVIVMFILGTASGIIHGVKDILYNK